MSQEGYIQTKVRELSEEVERLERKIEQHKEELKEAQKKESKIFDEQYNKLKPILDSEKVMTTLNDSFYTYINNKLGEEVKELTGLIHRTNKENAKRISNFADRMGKKLNEELTQLELKRDERIKALVDFLNEALNLNLVTGTIPVRFTKKDLMKARKKIEKGLQK